MSFLPRLHFRSIVGHYLIMGSVRWHPGPLQRIVAAENLIKYRSSTSLVKFSSIKYLWISRLWEKNRNNGLWLAALGKLTATDLSHDCGPTGKILRHYIITRCRNIKHWLNLRLKLKIKKTKFSGNRNFREIDFVRWVEIFGHLHVRQVHEQMKHLLL